jgi:alpha-beta hydrolase superfamily lysophospholipase
MVQTPETSTVAREEDWFEGADGIRLFERTWRPADKPKGAVIVVHGYAEHSGRYDHVGTSLAGAGYAVHAYDQRGHGRSDGARAIVRSMDEFLDDVDVFVARVAARYSAGVPTFLLGHSMGGGIVALHAIERRPAVRGLLLSGATVAGSERLGLRGWLIATLGRLLPRFPLIKLDAATVSRDPEVVRLYDTDPLNYRGRMKAGLVRALFLGGQRIARGAPSIDYPLLIMHGADDALVPSDASKRLFDAVASDDKTLKLYDGLYHEIFNEPERDAVLADVVAWLESRVETPS